MIKTAVLPATGSDEFPRLCRSRKGYVVLFIAPTRGTVVAREEGHPHELGSYGLSWVSCYETSHWTRMTPGESVTLTVS